ncbi:hypothetical protein SAMN04488041_102589 [Sulfitobacter pontiacus]|uniref:Uncharacterized protein n=1 Tax=Sulfitobacter pontiacus TaxID=60137 RepID=A0A1H2USN8_9RHOB|nr:hypothetical protein SAMN04488041_102589 [Sulfitobacter pontiacus]
MIQLIIHLALIVMLPPTVALEAIAPNGGGNKREPVFIPNPHGVGVDNLAQHGWRLQHEGRPIFWGQHDEIEGNRMLCDAQPWVKLDCALAGQNCKKVGGTSTEPGRRVLDIGPISTFAQTQIKIFNRHRDFANAVYKGFCMERNHALRFPNFKHFDLSSLGEERAFQFDTNPRLECRTKLKSGSFISFLSNVYSRESGGNLFLTNFSRVICHDLGRYQCQKYISNTYNSSDEGRRTYKPRGPTHTLGPLRHLPLGVQILLGALGLAASCAGIVYAISRTVEVGRGIQTFAVSYLCIVALGVVSGMLLVGALVAL